MNRRYLNERLALALNSDDLRLLKTHCDLDKIISSGWASRKQSLGCLAFWCKYVQDKRCVLPLRILVERICVSQSRRKHRGGSRAELSEIASAALVYFLNDTCPSCHGRGFIVDYDKQTDTQTPCVTCNGTRLRVYPSAHELGIDMEQLRFERIFNDVVLTLDASLHDYVKQSLYSLR